MTRRTNRQDAVNTDLDAAYATLPAMECKGKCWDSCGPIAMTEPERRRIAGRGVRIADGRMADGPAVCVALTMLRRCGVYDIRPAICRLWGMVPSLRCNFGCVPEGGLLSERDGYELLARIHEIAGQHAEAAQLRALFATPEIAERTERALREQDEQRRVAWDVRRRRAAANGTAMYVTGPGKLSRTPTEQAT